MHRLVGLAMATALLGVACGATPDAAQPAGGSTPSATQPATTPSTPSSPSTSPQAVDPRKGGFEIGFGEFAVTLEAQAIRPGEVTFRVTNRGTLVHGFEMKSESEGGNSGPGGGDDEFKVETETFGPGETLELDLTLAPGTYEIECFVADHDNRGMRAFLEVREDAPLVRPSPSGAGGVSIEGFAFQPQAVEAGPGDEITWTNADPAEHTVTARDGSFDSGILGPGGSFSATVGAGGEIAYFCQIHPVMEGSIRVTA